VGIVPQSSEASCGQTPFCHADDFGRRLVALANGIPKEEAAADQDAWMSYGQFSRMVHPEAKHAWTVRADNHMLAPPNVLVSDWSALLNTIDLDEMMALRV
jgi:hypothetical protein